MSDIKTARPRIPSPLLTAGIFPAKRSCGRMRRGVRTLRSAMRNRGFNTERETRCACACACACREREREAAAPLSLLSQG
ncbi:UNVERIFIED_CONTAM: hypothetical protein FKN15_056603 [Acipenser sinensis]